MRWQITLTLGGNTLILNTPGYSRGFVANSQQELVDITPNGTPVFAGPPTTLDNRRYIWTIAAQLSEEDTLGLEYFVRAQAPGTWVNLKDEVEYLEPEVAPQKTIFAGSRTIMGATTGFGSFDVWLAITSPKAHQGKMLSEDSMLKLITFTALEIF